MYDRLTTSRRIATRPAVDPTMTATATAVAIGDSWPLAHLADIRSYLRALPYCDRARLIVPPLLWSRM